MRFLSKPYRNLIWEVTSAQFAARDQSSVLGLLWSFLNPFLTMAVLYAWFRASAGKDVGNYAVYLLLGMVHFTHFSNATNTALGTLTSMAQLTRHTILPKETLVAGSVFASSVDFAVSMVLCLVIAAASGIPVRGAFAWIPAVMLLQLVFVMWVSLLLSATRVFLRDLSHLYQIFLRILFFVTPILYTSAFLRNPDAQRLLHFNPLAHLIGFSRDAVIGGAVFPWSFFLALLGIHLLALCGAFFWFKRLEARFAEYV